MTEAEVVGIGEIEVRRHTVLFFGHGLGVHGYEWYPPLGNSEEFTSIIFEDNVVEVGYLSITTGAW